MGNKQLTRIGICTALICVASYISFPLPWTPAMVTAQTLVINIIALVLRPKEAFLSMVLYIGMGVMGLPIFAGGMSGIGKILGPNGGYYIGFWVASVIMSFLRGKKISFKRYLLVTVCIGMPIIDVLGALFMSYYQKVSFMEVFIMSVLPFFIGDLTKCVAATYVSVMLKRALPSLREVYN